MQEADTKATLKLLSASEAAKFLGLSERSIQYQGKTWEESARRAGTANLPSSPKNGLRRVRLRARVHRYHPRDLEEFVENAVRETLDQPLGTWRKETAYYG
jgi:hypothetical protein